MLLHKIKSLYIAGVALALSVIPANANNATFSYNGANSPTSSWGTNKAEYYDIAIHIPELYAGKTITGIRMPFNTTSDDIKDVKLWLSEELSLEKNAAGKKVAAPDIITADATIYSEGYAEIMFSQPYTITEKGVYAGCSFNVTDITTETKNKRPIRLLEASVPGSLWIHTSKTYIKWEDMSFSLGSSDMQVYMTDVNDNSAMPIAPATIYTAYDKNFTVDLNVINTGANAVNDIDISYRIGDRTGSCHVVLDNPTSDIVSCTAWGSFDVPALNERGNGLNININIDKVNGVANSQKAAEVNAPIKSISFIPNHRAVCEEYTGFWCGYCPRGQIGLERMNALYPNDFIGIAYHNNDPMETTQSTDFPAYIVGYPVCWLDRTESCDPYLGYDTYTGSNIQFRFDKIWLAQAANVVMAAVDASATLSEDATYVEGTITVTPAIELETSDFQIELILTADDLHNDDWKQNNSYTEEDSDGGDDWLPFISGENPVKGLHFNDVFLASSRIIGNNIIINQPMADNVPTDYTYKFDLSTIYNTKGDDIIQDKNKLNFIALLIGSDGKIINAFKAPVKSTSGISAIDNAQQATVTGYYDLSGRKISNPERGIYIVRMSDGTSRKIMIQ